MLLESASKCLFLLTRGTSKGYPQDLFIRENNSPICTQDNFMIAILFKAFVLTYC